MNDRELLELAAKAAGLKIDKSPNNGGGARNDGFDMLGNAVLDWHNNKRWNPLINDGDALRLAVQLRLSISVNDRPMGVVRAYVPDDSVAAIDVPLAGDSYAATRRAIVMAAAAIAKMDGR